MDDPTEELLDQALEATEAALAQVSKLAVERIRQGAEHVPHLEAAERDLRNAMRQLALVSHWQARPSRAKVVDAPRVA